MKTKISIGLAMLLATVLALPATASQAAGKGPDDRAIQEQVERKLKGDGNLKNVRASVKDGMVTLEGSVKLYRDKVRAERNARGVRGSEGVRNLVQVQTDRVPDEQLREKLAEKLAYDRIDRGQMFNNMTLKVENGVVTVGGDVRDDADRDSALDIVARAPGVVEVIDQIHVAPVSNFDDDLRIRTARAIYGDPVLQKYGLNPVAPIRIVVERGNITLYGVVDNELDHRTAVMRAKQVAGGFTVTDRLAVASREPK